MLSSLRYYNWKAAAHCQCPRRQAATDVGVSKAQPSVAWISENQYRAGLGRASSNSCIMTCSNERENFPNRLHLSHISYNKRPYILIHFFHSLPLGANLRASSLPFSGRLEFLLTSSIHLVWAHRSRRFLTATRVTLFLHFLFVLAVAVVIFSLG